MSPGSGATVVEGSRLLISGGTVVNASGRREASVLVESGLVTAILDPRDETPPVGRVIDATGMLVLPGGVDPHCHVGQRLGDISMLDNYQFASVAALWGGTTTIIDFAIPEPGQTPLEAVHARRRLADASRCDTALHGGVVAWDSSTEAQLDAMAQLGVLTTKLFTTYRGGVMVDLDTISEVMRVNEQNGGLTLIHAEHNHLIEQAQQQALELDRRHARWHGIARPEEAEVAAVSQILAIAEDLGCAVYFVHQTTPEVVDLVGKARSRGVRAYSETCPHYLTLDESVYAGPAPETFVCCPPLRPAATVGALRNRVLGGGSDTIGSDHCCYSADQKRPHADDAVYAPNGLPGVETRLSATFHSLVVEGGMNLEDFVALVSTTPARLNGLRGKGYIAPGADADLVVFDPAATRVVTTADLHMATDYTPYEGRRFTGWPQVVISNGRVVVDPDGFHDPGPVGRQLRSRALLDGHRHVLAAHPSTRP